MKKNQFLLLIIIVYIVLTLTGCKKKVEKLDEPIHNDKITIGFSLGTLMEDRWIRDRDIFISMAQEKNIDVIVNNANKDSDLQYRQVQEMINQNIDILVIAPNDSESEAKCVKAAKARNIPVISYDRLVYNSNVDVYISFDNEEVGKLMAETLIDKKAEGGYLIISGAKNDNNSQMVHDGWMEVLDPYLKSKRIKILGETWVEGWKRELAYEFVSKEIKTHGEEISGILAGNDSLAWGAIDALSEARIGQKVEVAGQDADLVACQRIISGEQTVTIYKPIKKLVSETVDACIKLVNGEEINGHGTINDGIYDIPYIYISVKAVTESTIDETVIKDGFHLADDLYLE